MRRVLFFLVALAAGCGGEADKSMVASTGTGGPKPGGSATASASAVAHLPEPPLVPLAVGAPAPDVTMTLADGKKVALSGEKGKFVLVYFYPEDETKGCTIEAESLRDATKDFDAAGIEVFGVSMQGAESHKAFAAKHELKFPLVVDEDASLANAFHVPHDDKHTKRQSFLIGKDGKVAAVWLDVDPSTHAAQVLAAAAKLTPVVVEIKANGDVYFAGKKLAKPEDAVASAKDAVAKNPDVAVSVVAEASVPNASVIQAMDRLKQGGVKNLSMSVPPPKNSMSVPPPKK